MQRFPFHKVRFWDGMQTGKFLCSLWIKVSTRSDCECDLKFRECLQNTNETASIHIGVLFFTIFGLKCFREDFPIISCQEYGGYKVSWLIKSQSFSAWFFCCSIFQLPASPLPKVLTWLHKGEGIPIFRQPEIQSSEKGGSSPGWE